MLCKTADQRAIFDRIERRIDAAPRDGMNADGEYSETVRMEQLRYIDGLRSARLAAIKAIEPN